ncbi:MAG: GNAT family N-acetyltransferase [Clostridia bacterium]|nr:GNAT family N-acetyltransferase [Clostridia bacterium]
MLIKADEKYIPSLIKLWNEVFGDDEKYIRLFFKKLYFLSECFAIIENEEIISAFYLLKCSIKYDGKIYKGRYLYAAATLPTHRGKGLMSALLNESIEYSRKEKLDFIALVPAGDSLYDYYGRFGFIESMYKYKYSTNRSCVTLRGYHEIDEVTGFCKIRNSADNMLIYDDNGLEYAFDCLKFSDNKIICAGEKSYYIDGEELFIGDYEDKDSVMNFLSSLGGERTIFSNRPYDDCEKIRNGMLYTFNEELKNKEIYMNIALD